MRGVTFCLALVVTFVVVSIASGLVVPQVHGQANGDADSYPVISAELHYYRIPHAYWQDRMQKARALGCNAVSTYVFWNLHEPRPGEFRFDGEADVAAFVPMQKLIPVYSRKKCVVPAGQGRVREIV